MFSKASTRSGAWQAVRASQGTPCPQAFNLDLFCELAQVGCELEAILPGEQLTRGACRLQMASAESVLKHDGTSKRGNGSVLTPVRLRHLSFSCTSCCRDRVLPSTRNSRLAEVSTDMASRKSCGGAAFGYSVGVVMQSSIYIK